MIALDLFAGHGWGVACQRLGIEEFGVEIMPEARAIRAANGMRTPFSDVWDVLLTADPASPEFQAALQIASPPCQTFSMAGGGAGRRALDEVLGLIDDRAYLRPADLHAFGEKHDPRTALVLTPLAMVARHAPTYVVWEQVPPVLPVWERAAEEMRAWGYGVWTGILKAEQYGVPQTRRRAVLIARADGKEAAPPTSTHSRYYSHDPKRLDPGVLPWVSMANALGWNEAERVGFARRTDGRGEVTPDGYRARDLRQAELPAHHLTEKARSWTRTRPATTAMRVSVAEAAALQSYPPDFVWDVMVTKERMVRAWDRRRDPSDPDDEGEYHLEPRGIETKPITKTKQFLTIGNAVPPLMAEAILKAAIS